jgi:phage terminase small subunit
MPKKTIIPDTTKSRLAQLKSQLDEPKEVVLKNTQLSIEDDTTVLTTKQLQFVIEYIKDLNATQAAIRSGYSEKTAGQISCGLLKKANVHLEIRKRQEVIALANNVTKEYIQTQLIQLINDCYNDEKTDRASILKAFDMMAKMNSLYTPQVQVNIQNNNIDVSKLFGFDTDD